MIIKIRQDNKKNCIHVLVLHNFGNIVFIVHRGYQTNQTVSFNLADPKHLHTDPPENDIPTAQG